MKYCVYAVDKITRFLVAGGGLGNGNHSAYIEFLTNEPNDVWYVEYGSNPVREHIGSNGIEYLDQWNIKVLTDTTNDIITDSDTE
jgi:hypothetical protein